MKDARASVAKIVVRLVVMNIAITMFTYPAIMSILGRAAFSDISSLHVTIFIMSFIFGLAPAIPSIQLIRIIIRQRRAAIRAQLRQNL